MDICINSDLREDIKILSGGNLTTNSAHKTSSSLSVMLPSTSSISECDYIKLVDDETTIFAGTILKCSQENVDNLDCDYKIFSLSIASNADLIASVMCDMFFDKGTSIKQILYGSDDTSVEYFAGLLNYKITPEDITIGVIDDFSNITLSQDVSLWGMYVTDVLDSLCETANAWWEITADKVFNMRFNLNSDNSPYTLNSDSQVTDVKVAKDALTTYSAVRVIGGNGKGPLRIEWISEYTAEEICTKYPIHSVENEGIIDYYNSFDGTELRYGMCIDDAMPIANHYYKLYPKGLNASAKAYYSYGSNNITPLDGRSFMENSTATIAYYPLVRIATRIQSDKFAGEITEKRGGTGTIEYLLKDSSITDYQSAVQAGISFLDNSGKFATEIKFKSREVGYRVGDILRGCNIPYYAINGDYKINSVTANFISDELIEYSIEASNVAVRDKSLKLFGKAEKQTFVIKNELPASTGTLIESEIEVLTTVSIRASKPLTWEELEGKDLTWAQKDALDLNWEEIENTIEEVTNTGHYLTSIAKQALTDILTGKGTEVNMNINAGLKLYSDQSDLPSYDNTGSLVTGNQILTTYTVADEVNDRIDVLESRNEDDEIMQSMQFYYEKPSEVTLTISKKDVIL